MYVFDGAWNPKYSTYISLGPLSQSLVHRFSSESKKNHSALKLLSQIGFGTIQDSYQRLGHSLQFPAFLASLEKEYEILCQIVVLMGIHSEILLKQRLSLNSCRSWWS